MIICNSLCLLRHLKSEGANCNVAIQYSNYPLNGQNLLFFCFLFPSGEGGGGGGGAMTPLHFMKYVNR